MTKIIKDLNTFSEELRINEEFNLGNLLSGALDFAGEGLRRTIKEKIAASIMEIIGVEENSLLSGLVQEVVEEIPVKDYPSILTGDKANVEYLAPHIVVAMEKFIERKGFDPIAEKIGIDPRGWLYKTIINGVQSPEGREKLKLMLIDAFGGKNAKGSVARDAISSLLPGQKEQLSDSVKKEIASVYGKSVKPEEKIEKGLGDYASAFLGSLFGNK